MGKNKQKKLFAIMLGKLENAKLASIQNSIDMGCELNSRNKGKKGYTLLTTLLHYCAKKPEKKEKYLEKMRLLCRHGAKWDLKDGSGVSPEKLASSILSQSEIKWVLDLNEQKVKLENQKIAKQDKLFTKLLNLLADGTIDEINKIVNKKVNLNTRIKGKKGYTLLTALLHYCDKKPYKKEEYLKKMRLLCRHGAKWDLKDGYGVSPKKLASSILAKSQLNWVLDIKENKDRKEGEKIWDPKLHKDEFIIHRRKEGELVQGFAQDNKENEELKAQSEIYDADDHQVNLLEYQISQEKRGNTPYHEMGMLCYTGKNKYVEKNLTSAINLLNKAATDPLFFDRGNGYPPSLKMLIHIYFDENLDKSKFPKFFSKTHMTKEILPRIVKSRIKLPKSLLLKSISLLDSFSPKYKHNKTKLYLYHMLADEYNHPYSQAVLVDFYVERDEKLLFKYLEKAAENGNYYCQYELAKIIPSESPLYKNSTYWFEKAFFGLTEAASNNNHKALATLAEMYHHGHYVKKDIKQAQQLYLQSNKIRKNKKASDGIRKLRFNFAYERFKKDNTTPISAMGLDLFALKKILFR